MRLLRQVSMIAFVTILALVYVHQQVELVKLSYALEYKEKKLKDILDHKEILQYNIDNLEAPSRLEGVLASQKIDIAFPKRANVVKMAALSRTHKYRLGHQKTVGLEQKINFLGILDFLSPRAEAQAEEK